MSMKEDCMPGRTFETRPLYTLPTVPRWRSRSTKTSATRSSSRMATIVSCPLDETIISFCIHELLGQDRKSTRLNSSHVEISYAVFCLKKKKKNANNDKRVDVL